MPDCYGILSAFFSSLASNELYSITQRRPPPQQDRYADAGKQEEAAFLHIGKKTSVTNK